MRQTSLEAYKELCDSGKGDTQRAKVLQMILHKPGMTRAELSRVTNIPINAVCGRVNELVKEKVIEEGERVECTVTGNSAFQLRPVEPAGEQMSFAI